jgi:hypothetical protein
MRSPTTAATVLAAYLVLPSSAEAINAGDVMDTMEQRERLGFIGGAVDMASHIYAVNGNREKADCAVSVVGVFETSEAVT